MNGIDVLAETFGRIPDGVHAALEGLPEDALNAAPGDGNPVGWLVWHIGRVVDAQLAELDGEPEVWIQGKWAQQFGLPADARDTGYGHTPEQVRTIRPADAQTLRNWTDAVALRSEEFLAACRPEDLDRPVDPTGDPALTWGVRLVSIAEDCLAHVGQVGYVRGLVDPLTG